MAIFFIIPALGIVALAALISHSIKKKDFVPFALSLAIAAVCVFCTFFRHGMGLGRQRKATEGIIHFAAEAIRLGHAEAVVESIDRYETTRRQRGEAFELARTQLLDDLVEITEQGNVNQREIPANGSRPVQSNTNGTAPPAGSDR